MAEEVHRAVEAIVMVAEAPVEPGLLAQLLELPVDRIEEICSELALSYEAEDRGFQLQRVAGGYRFASHPDLAAYVERFVLEGQSTRLSSAALETLAIVAYKQPVSRVQVSAIRGVDADGVLRTLVQRGYVAEVARDPGPGQAVLYGTTRDLPGAARPRLARATCPRWASSCPAPRWSRPSSRACACPTTTTWWPPRPGPDPGHRRPRADEDGEPEDPEDTEGDDRRLSPSRANGCRRSWPGPGSAAAGSVRS